MSSSVKMNKFNYIQERFHTLFNYCCKMIQKQTLILSIDVQMFNRYRGSLDFMEEQDGMFGGMSQEEFVRKYVTNQRIQKIQERLFGAWDKKQVQRQPSQRIKTQQKQTIEPKPQKKKRKDQFKINQRLLKKEKPISLEAHSNKNLRKYDAKYFEYLQSLRENDFSVFNHYEYQLLKYQKTDKDMSTKDLEKQQSSSGPKPKRIKKRQIYMPSVVKTFQKPKYKNQDSLNSETMPENKDEPHTEEFQIKKYEMRKRMLKQQIIQLQVQANRKDISSIDYNQLNQQKKRIYKKIKHMDYLLSKKQFKQLAEDKITDVKSVQRSMQPKIYNKSQAQYQKYIKETTQKKARKDQLLQQEELRTQRKKQFQQKIKRSTNPLYAVSQMHDQMSKKGNQLIKKLQKMAGLKPTKGKQKQLKSYKIEKQPQIQRKTKHKEFKEHKEQVQAQNKVISRNQQPLWRRELMNLTGYDPNSQKYRDRDREQIHQSGFSRIEKQDKFSRRQARKQQKLAAVNGQVEEI